MCRCHTTPVQSVRFNISASLVLSCGADNQLVATEVDRTLMEMYSEVGTAWGSSFKIPVCYAEGSSAAGCSCEASHLFTDMPTRIQSR